MAKEKELEEKYKTELDELKKKNNDLKNKISKLQDKIKIKNEKLKELGEEVIEENDIEDLEKESFQDFKNEENNQIIYKESEIGNLIDKSLYEKVNNEYLKLKEEYEEFQIKKNSEIQNLKMNNEQILDQEKNKMLIEFRKKEMNYLKESDEKLKIISDKNLKNAELENQIKQINNSLNNSYKKIKQYENIVIKQENVIDKLKETINQNESSLQIKKNEIELKTSDIIELKNELKEQQNQIKNIKNSHFEKETNEILRLKTEIKTLKNTIEIKNESLKKIQNTHKILQERYLKMCSENRLKYQRDLLKKTKEMKLRKLDLELHSSLNNLPKKKPENKSLIFNNEKSQINDNSILPPINITQNIIPLNTDNNINESELNFEEKNNEDDIQNIITEN